MKFPIDSDYILVVPPSHPLAKHHEKTLKVYVSADVYINKPTLVDAKKIEEVRKPKIEFKEPELTDEDLPKRPWWWMYGI